MSTAAHRMVTTADRHASKSLGSDGRVLVVGPGRKGRGGISAVVSLHRKTATWKRRRMSMLETYDDRGRGLKLWSAFSAYVRAPFLLLTHDLLHVHLAAQTSVLRKLPILIMAKALGRPVIVHIHAPSESSLFSLTKPWALQTMLRCADRLVALSPAWATTFEGHGVGVPVSVIPNPTTVQERPTRRSEHQARVVLFVGKLEDRKGYSDLLAAAPRILDLCPTAEFRFAGQGALEQARKQAETLGIEEAVHFLGWTEGAALEAEYAQADVVVLPSFAEGVPMSILEAMGQGIPVVCTPVGGLPELIRDGENGLFVHPGDVAGIAAQVCRVLSDESLAARVGRCGQVTVQQRCSVETVSALLEELYQDVLTRHRRVVA